MYILTDEPGGGQLGDAFNALDGAFGTGEFSEGQALTTIINALECSSEDASGIFSRLINSNSVSETD